MKDVNPKKHSKRIIIIIVIVCLIIIATATTLLIGYFKFNWFQKQPKDIYQTDYFTETKIINSRVDFSNGKFETFEQKIYTNFMIIQTDKKELENNDFLNIATLVILDTKATFNNITKDITSFNIFNESTVEEFKSNPDGAKYPMATFSFNENGTFVDIQLPNNMNKYYADCIIELIENYISKLSINKTENIDTKEKIADINKKTFYNTQSPKEIKNIKGSRFVKSIEMDFDGEKLRNIRTYSNLSLQSQNKEDQYIFGLKNFQTDTKSEIILTETKTEKDNIGLVQNLTKYYTFIESKELLELFTDEIIQYVGEKSEEDENIRDIQYSKSNSKQYSEIINIKNFDVLGNELNLKANYGIKNKEIFFNFIFQSKAGKINIGTSNTSYEFKSTEEIIDITIFRVEFLPLSSVKLDIKIGGSMTFSWSVCPTCETKNIDISVSGELSAIAEISAGFEYFAKVAAGAKGTILSAGLNVFLGEDEKFHKYGYIRGGNVTTYVSGKLLNMTVYDESWKIWDGWIWDFN